MIGTYATFWIHNRITLETRLCQVPARVHHVDAQSRVVLDDPLHPISRVVAPSDIIGTYDTLDEAERKLRHAQTVWDDETRHVTEAQENLARAIRMRRVAVTEVGK